MTGASPARPSRNSQSTTAVIGHWINGAEECGAKTFDVFDPSTAEPYARAADGAEMEVSRAVEAATAAYLEKWSGLSTADRSDLILGVMARLEPHLHALAAVESRDTGKPISFVAELEAPTALAEFRHYAAASRHWRDSMHGGAATGFGVTMRQPYGVVGLITPFNSPLLVMAEKVAQILAAGNCVVIKPSPLAPASATMLARLLTEAGLPPGVVNVVQGSGPTAGKALCEHQDVHRLSFTGSTRVGREILGSAATQLKRVTLELSGKNACLIFPDADLDKACSNAVLSGFMLSGQLCTSGSRILVHRDIAESFISRFIQQTSSLRIGNSNKTSTQLGPLISAEHLASVQQLIKQGTVDGEVLYAGTVPKGLTGWFAAPHVYRMRNAHLPLMQEEVFGPVSCIMEFDSDDEAIAIANSTRYGLASFVWTNDWRRIHRCLRELDTGRIWVNTGHTIPADMTLAPWKLSGLGEEGGLEGLLSFTRVKTANINASGSVPSF
jgi:aminomuconate-semialdehyde/2-hydroxymuconate-6-semialdehyde dehydrogenase